MNLPNQLVRQLQNIGLKRGDVVMVHSSFKAIGIENPEEIILALLETLSEHGTLLLPALSYLQTPPDIYNTNHTPSCVGFLSEYFRLRPGTTRSLHPTHSACGVGKFAHEWLADHIQDHTPCGPHSPFNKLLNQHGKILMIGCGLKPNTTMHAIEEYIQPPYLFGTARVYTITDSQGRMFTKEYIPHDFESPRAAQRYDRVAGLMTQDGLSFGYVGHAEAFMIQAEAMFQVALSQMQIDPLYFVDLLPEA